MQQAISITPSYACLFWQQEPREVWRIFETDEEYSRQIEVTREEYNKFIKTGIRPTVKKTDTTANRFLLQSIKNISSGSVSAHAAKRLRLSVNILNELATTKTNYDNTQKKYYDWKLNLITLTLPFDQAVFTLKKHLNYYQSLKFEPIIRDNIAFIPVGNWIGRTDKFIKQRYLNQFLIEFKSRWNPTGYIWKSESQRNGRLHFHITCDRYIHYDSLQNLWNRILDKDNLLDEFKAAHPGMEAPSTHVTAVERVHDMASYIIKELSKNQPNRRKIQGKLWDCSMNLKPRKKCQILIEPSEIDHLKNLSNSYQIEERPEKYFTLYFRKQEKWQKILPQRLASIYTRWLYSCKPPPLPKKSILRSPRYKRKAPDTGKTSGFAAAAPRPSPLKP